MHNPEQCKAKERYRCFIGQNCRGNWVVQDKEHRRGGLFVDRREAIRFALFEVGGDRQSAIMVPGGLELDFHGKPAPGMVAGRRAV